MEANALMIAEIAGPVFVVLGLSFLLYAKVWQKIIDGWLRSHYAMIPVALLQLVLGIVVVRIYNVWTLDIGLLVTLIGWIMILKSVVFFLAPGQIVKWALKMKKMPALLALSSLILIAWGGILGYFAYFTTLV